MKLYIAAHSQEEARKVATLCEDQGHVITSSWLNEDFSRTSSYTEDDKRKIAVKDVNEVLESDALVLLPSPMRIPGGKFVEVGVALGARMHVYILGHRENMLMWHPFTRCFNSAEDFLKSVASKQSEQTT